MIHATSLKVVGDSASLFAGYNKFGAWHVYF